MEYTSLFPAHKESTTCQSTDSPKVHIGEPISFIGVTDRDVGENVPARKECLEDSCITSPSQHGLQLTKLGYLEHTVQTSGSTTGWRVSFPGDLVCLNFFKATDMI